MNLLFATRLTPSKWSSGRLMFVIFSALLICAHWSPLAYGANATAVVQAVNSATPQLFYPTVYNSYSDATRTWKSTLAVQNLSQANSTVVQVTFYNENGQTFTPSSLGSIQNNFTLNPKATVTLPIENVTGITPNARYTAVLSSVEPLGGVNWVRIFNSSGSLESHETLLGFPPQTATTAYLPSFVKAVNNFNSNLAVQNLSNSALSNVVLTIFDQNGNQASQVQAPPIPPYSAWYLPLANTNVATGFSGSLIATASSPIALVDNQLGGSNSATLIANRGAGSGAQTLYAPFLNALNGASATLIIQNTSISQQATVNVTNSDGVGNTQVNIPPRASRTISYNAGSHAGFAATITANQPVVALAAQQINTNSSAAVPVFEQGMTNFVFPLMVRQYQNAGSNAVFNSAMSFYNPGATAAQLSVEYNNSILVQNVLNPGQYFNLPIANIGNFQNNAPGALVFSATQPLFGLNGVIGQNVTGDLLTAYPATPLQTPAVTIHQTASTPYLKPGDPLTYTLSLAVGANGGSATIADLLPSQLLTHTYNASAGVMVTPTGNVDYQWNADVPAAGGVIQVGGIVDSTLVTDTLLVNTAVITANNSSASSTQNVIVDATPPNTLINTKPANPSNNQTPTFQFSATDGAGSGVAGFECQVDNGNWNSCNAVFTLSTLNDGPHTLAVRALDRVGFIDPTPASYTWTVDLTAPPTPNLVAPAAGLTLADTQFVTLTWDASVAADLAGYKVTFNGGVVDVGNTTHYAVGPLANGTYSWKVVAYDGLGNTSAAASERAFTIDVAVPKVLAFAPLANSQTAPVNTSIGITFDQAIDAATVTTSTFAIHGMQSGQRLQNYSTNGATLTFTPNQPFKPGELVQVSASSGLRNSNGFTFTPPQVWQFRTRVTQGSGQFPRSQTLAPTNAIDILPGDVDGDGDLDLIVGLYRTHPLVYLNNGDGTFATPPYTVGNGATDDVLGVAVGDVNGDGRLDLALAMDFGPDKIYLNDGNGNPFDTTVVELNQFSLNGGGAFAIALGDVDGDGDLDVINGRYGLFLNDGHGAFATPPLAISGAGPLAFGDVNQDGRLDLVMRGVVYINDGVGNPYDTTSYAIGASGNFTNKTDLAVGDVNNDGKLDVVLTTASATGETKVYLNDGIGNPFDTLAQTLPLAPGNKYATDVVLGDLDGDGDLDLVVGNQQALNQIYRNDGTGNFSLVGDFGVDGATNVPYGLSLGDLDGDGDLDLAAATFSNNAQVIYFNDPATPTPTPTTAPGTPTPTDTPSLNTPTPTDTPSLNTPTPTDTPSLNTPTPTNTSNPNSPTPTPPNTPTTTGPTPTPTATAIPGTPTAIPTLPTSDATTVAQPGQPATLNYTDPSGGGVVVQIPGGAINQPTTFLYDDHETPSHTGAFQFAGRTFTLTAYRDNSAVTGFTFQQPVTLVIDYTDSDVAGLDENSLTLFFYDVANDVWSEQGITVVSRDPANNRITVQINHLTEFAMGMTNRIYMPMIKQ